jgi:hypothetical protein
MLPQHNEDIFSFAHAEADRVVKAQLAAADQIVANQDYIAKIAGRSAIELQRVSNGLEGLAAAFEWGLAELTWQIEQQRAVLENIVDTHGQSPWNSALRVHRG